MIMPTHVGQLTFNVSLNSGFNVCFFTFVFLLPLFDLSGSKYTLTYLGEEKKNKKIKK